MTHHAYYIEGPQAQFGAYKEHLKPLHSRVYEKFGIDEARELTNLAALKNYKESVFLLAIAAITSEAQQALLKLFEEPQAGTTFVLLLPHGVLLPTLRSRMLAYSEKVEFSVQKVLGSPVSRKSALGPDYFARKIPLFLKSSNKERGDFIAKLLKEEDREKVRDFINALEVELHKKVAEPKARQGLADIILVRRYLSDRSPSLKMLLEHLALSV